MNIKEIKVFPKIDRSFESCDDCIHADDTEEICVLRRCVHAIGTLTECYRPRKVDCTDCIKDGTDACTRGAGRAVDSEPCSEFLGGKK